MAAHGISVIPVGTNKLPFGRWKQFQDQLPTPQQLDQAFDKLPHNCSIATIGGAVSGQLVIIDFDADDEGNTIYPQLAELVESQRPEIWKRLVKNTTPSRGYHLRYRVDGQVEGNTKLATSAQGQVRIETRGEGGYAGYKDDYHDDIAKPYWPVPYEQKLKWSQYPDMVRRE